MQADPVFAAAVPALAAAAPVSAASVPKRGLSIVFLLQATASFLPKLFVSFLVSAVFYHLTTIFLVQKPASPIRLHFVPC